MKKIHTLWAQMVSLQHLLLLVLSKACFSLLGLSSASEKGKIKRNFDKNYKLCNPIHVTHY